MPSRLSDLIPLVSRPPVNVFREADIVEAMPLDAKAVTAVEKSFAELAAGGVFMPPTLQFLIGKYAGQTCVKGAWIPSLDYFAVKLSSIYPRQPGTDASEPNGLFIVLESATGRVHACLLDNGYLTQLRTAAAGAVAVRYLAPTNVETVGIVGSGKQALWQVQAAYLFRKFSRVLIWSRNEQQADAMARRVESLLQVSATVVATVHRAVAPAQLVITTTPSHQPLLTQTELHPTLHVSAIGSDAPGKRELSDCFLRHINLYVADDLNQCAKYGELKTIARGELARVAVLGDIVTGKALGRGDDSEVTVADLTGVGVQDTAIAIEALKRLTALPA